MQVANIKEVAAPKETVNFSSRLKNMETLNEIKACQVRQAEEGVNSGRNRFKRGKLR